MHETTGVLTFLFTDVEGSTRRWEADPEEMRSALAQHDEVLRSVISGCGGEVFKHTGDGMCAAFVSSRTAVEAAITAQRSLKLPVRMGLATGEAEHRDGDYFGTVLNRAARVMAAGHGGQILLDDATAGLLDGVGLIDLGPRRLRDISRPTRILQISAPGLQSTFPPLRSLDPTPGNLRLPGSAIIGRERELHDADRSLRESQLVTLTGVGGVGKTRLAMEAAARLADRFPDGVWVIELATVTDAPALPDAAAAVLGVLQQPGRTVTESVAAAVKDRTMLLVMDNCEHVLDAAADFAQAILERCTSVRILATSREGLRVNGELLQPVSPLDVDDAQASAATLFARRAREADPGFVSDADDDVIVDICRRLDGIPLAIELAASRIVSMTASEIRDRLDDRFRLLVGSPRLPARHQTLRQTVQWSYDQLSDVERLVLEKCSIFAGSFDLVGAAAVTGTDDEFAMLDHLEALVRKSLVLADKSASHTRYTMLETIREFAKEHLSASGGLDTAHAQHARHYARRAGAMVTDWDGPRQPEVYEWVTTELPDLRAAFRWAVNCNEIDTAATIAVSAGFLGGWIELHEPSTWAEEIVELARERRHPRLLQLYVAASECYRTGRVDDAIRYTDNAISVGESEHFLPALYDIDTTALGGTFATAGLLERWVNLCRSRPVPKGSAGLFARASLVMALRTSGRDQEAAAECESLTSAADTTRNPGAIAFAMLACGYAWRDRQPVRAYEALLRGLAIAHASGNKMTESYIAVNMSGFADALAGSAEVLDLLTLAINNFHNSGSYEHMVSPLGVLATRLAGGGRPEAAATILGFAATAFSMVTFPEIVGTIASLRNELGDETYESLCEVGARMSRSEIARFALGQIAEARQDLQSRDTR